MGNMSDYSRLGITSLREFWEYEFRPRYTGWRGLDAEAAIEEFIRCYERDAYKRLEVPCDGGVLVASFFGDAGVFDGIMVDFRRDDGESVQCALVETDHDLEGELHTYTWDGTSEEYVGKQVVAKSGELYGDEEG